MKVTKLAPSVIYVENVVTEHKEFLSEIDCVDKSKTIFPDWQKWIDGGPVKIDLEDGTSTWIWQPDEVNCFRGYKKFVDWDYTINKSNLIWPRVEITAGHSSNHAVCLETIEKINTPYIEALKVWSDITKLPIPEVITKNYIIKKYRVDGIIHSHVDRNYDDPDSTQDWTALIYLTDDYEGGELIFDDLDIELKPSAGSIVFFPCDLYHRTNSIISGDKVFIFMYIHSKYGVSTSEGESSQRLTLHRNESNV